MVRLEIYVDDMHGEPMANITCNVVPRVDETITLLDGEERGNRSGSYRVRRVDHMLDERRVESIQHVCLVVVQEGLN